MAAPRLDSGILPRLLADADAHASAGRVREATVLLRWASRVAAPEFRTLVLLAWRHVDSVRRDTGGAAAGRPASPEHRPDADIERGRIGLPIPRFPTRRPELDVGAFVPAPRHAEQQPLAPPPAAAPAYRGARRRRWVAAVVLASSMAALAVAPHRAVWSGRLSGAARAEEEAAAALRAGDPARAAAIAQSVADPPPALILIRGRALLVLGDTSAGAAALAAAASHPLAGPETAGAAAHILGSLPGRDQVAADAYLAAVAAGLPREDWPVAAEVLQRAGRPGQARRLREMAVPARGHPPVDQDGDPSGKPVPQ